VIQTINLGQIPIGKKRCIYRYECHFLGLLLIQPFIHLPANQGCEVVCKHL